MTEKIYYIQNSNNLTSALKGIKKFAKVDRELIEMDYSKITVKCNPKDLAKIEGLLAELM